MSDKFRFAVYVIGAMMFGSFLYYLWMA